MSTELLDPSNNTLIHTRPSFKLNKRSTFHSPSFSTLSNAFLKSIKSRDRYLSCLISFLFNEDSIVEDLPYIVTARPEIRPVSVRISSVAGVMEVWRWFGVSGERLETGCTNPMWSASTKVTWIIWLQYFLIDNSNCVNFQQMLSLTVFFIFLHIFLSKNLHVRGLRLQRKIMCSKLFLSKVSS